MTVIVVNYMIFASMFFVIAFRHVDKRKIDFTTIISVCSVAMLWPIILLTFVFTICAFLSREIWKSFKMER